MLKNWTNASGDFSPRNLKILSFNYFNLFCFQWLELSIIFFSFTDVNRLLGIQTRVFVFFFQPLPNKGLLSVNENSSDSIINK